MKKVVALMVVATFFAALSPITAGAAPGPQEETGTVLLPFPEVNGGEGCWAGVARRFHIFTGGAADGPFGATFEIDETTWGGKFKLEVAGATGNEDLDLQFYVDPGQLDPADPAQQSLSESSGYHTRKAGGESGLVPELATVALTCLVVGTGYDADFKYTANPPAKKKKR